jgi:hypothetical protein
MVNAGDARDGRDHHAGKQLHGGDVALIECAWRRRENFEDAEGSAIRTKRRDQNGASAEAAATGEIDAGVALGIVAEHDFAGAHGFGRNAGVSLQADTVRPARARQTISSPARRAMAAPVAPVRCWARSVMALIAGSKSSSPA